MRGDILFLAHRIPFPPNRGDKIRSHHVLRRLARMAPVHVGCLADDAADLAEEVELAQMAASYKLVRRTKPLVLAGLEALWKRQAISLAAFHDPQLAAYVEDLLASGRIGTVYVFSGQMGQYVPRDFTGQLIVDFVDVDSAKFEAYAAQGGVMGPIHAREARKLAAEEARLAARADVNLLVSHEEAELFAGRLPLPGRYTTRVQAMGNGIDSDYFTPVGTAPAEPLQGQPGPRLIFTGQMDYAPNVAAVERLARRILPQVQAVLPEASVHILGRNPDEAVSALADVPGVSVWGAVPDMRPWLKAADMAVVPLEIARGVQNKVLEAMAMALPVVLTSGAATGISAVPGHHFAVADSDEALARTIVELGRDMRRAHAMGQEARRFVVEQQGWASALAPLASIMAELPPARGELV